MSDFNTEGFSWWWDKTKKLYDGDSQLCALRAWQHQQKRIEELEAALRSLADDEWWDMETPTTAADFAAKALRGK